MNLSLISFGFFGVKFFGLFIFVAILYWAFGMGKVARRLGQRYVDIYHEAFWYWLFGALLGGWFLSFLIFRPWPFYPWEYMPHVIGCLVAFLGFFWLQNLTAEEKLKWLDLSVSVFLRALFILELGILLTGAVYGTLTSMPWGIAYEAHNVEILGAVHPIGLYLLFGHIMIYRFTHSLQTPWSSRPGRLFVFATLLCLGWYWLVHFFVYDRVVLWAGISGQQLLCLGLMVLCYVLLRTDMKWLKCNS